MGRINVLSVMAIAVFGLSAAQADTLYKWVDSQGRVSYHDQPPPDGAGYQVQEKVLGPSNKTKQDDTLSKITEKYPVVLYAVPGCPSCDQARAYLQKRKVPFTDQNVENNTALQETLKKKVGAVSVPTITIGDKVMKGYLESILEGELDDAGYPKIETPESAAGENPGKDNTPTPGDSGYSPARSRY